VERVVELVKKDKAQGGLFDDLPDEPMPIKTSLSGVDDFSDTEKLAFEKEFLGIYLTSHPQMHNLQYMKSYISHELEHITDELMGKTIKTGGIIESTKRIFTKKNNDEMAFILLADENGRSIECVVFPKTFQRYKNYLLKDTVIIVEGHVDNKSDKSMLIVDRISPVIT